MANANFYVHAATEERIILRDLGPHDKYLTITNDAEHVVEQLAKQYDLTNRRIIYMDTDNEFTELLVKDNKFDGFKLLFAGT